MPAPALFWFRQDLRLADNPALRAALALGVPVVPVFVLDESTPGRWRPGGAARWWLHHSLVALDAALRKLGARLILRRGDAQRVIPELARELGAGAVFWNRCYEPFAIARDTALKARLVAAGLRVDSHKAALLFEPWTIRTGSGGPFKVFTPFWRACLAAAPPPAPLPAPSRWPVPADWPASDALADWRLLPTTPDWAGGLRAAWTPGEAGAAEKLQAFLAPAAAYAEARDRPDKPGTSRLSPHLHWGEIGPGQIWHALRADMDGAGDKGRETFLKELGWREFSYHLLYQAPSLPETPFQPRFAGFPWRDDPQALRAWQRGRTGYPLVDAGMRELWHTGWMHNRVRMIVASFLTKHLLIPWQDGAAWFWDTLVDADLASNSASWQWVAGCGADAAPYFRIFSPVLQGETFDPEGAYIRRWVPELSRLPARHIHRPWAAGPAELAGAGIVLGRTYPRPLVDHAAARARALAALAQIARKSTD